MFNKLGKILIESINGTVPKPKNAMNIAPEYGVAVTKAPANAKYTMPQGKNPFNIPNSTNLYLYCIVNISLKNVETWWLIFDEKFKGKYLLEIKLNSKKTPTEIESICCQPAIKNCFPKYPKNIPKRLYVNILPKL